MTQLLTLEDALGDLLGLADLEPLKGGRTNQVWRSGELIVKLYGSGSETPLFGNSPDDEWAALTGLQGLGIAPDPFKQNSSDQGNILIYKYISGEFGYTDIADAAAILGAVHGIKPPSKLPLMPTGRAVLDHGSEMISKGHELHDFKPTRIGAGASAFIHRDPVFSNFVMGPDGLRLVDWQCPGIGDPVEDLAHFISPGMNLLYRGKALDQAEIDRFLQHYPNQNVVEQYRDYGQGYHWRMACYCAWQVERGNATYVPALSAERDILANWRY